MVIFERRKSALASVVQRVGVTSPRGSGENAYTVKSVIGKISHTSSSYLVTAGTDRHIRYWDFLSPNKCFTISGLEPAQPKPCYESPAIEGSRILSSAPPLYCFISLFPHTFDCL